MADMADLWKAGIEEIQSLDKVIDSWNPEGGTRTKYKNQLIADTESSWKGTAEKLIAQLSGEDVTPEQKTGIYLGFVKALQKAFDKDASAFIDAQVEAMPKAEAVTVSDEERKKVTTSRSETYNKLRKLYELADGFGMKGDDWELPEARRASSGKRGPRALSLVDWFIDGEGVDEDSNTPRGVSKLLGFASPKELTQALKDAGVNTTEPDLPFEVEINGKMLKAVAGEDAEEEATESDPEPEAA